MKGGREGGRRDERNRKGGVMSGFWVKEPQLLFLHPSLPPPSSFDLHCHIFQSLQNLTFLINPWPIISCPLPPLPHLPPTVYLCCYLPRPQFLNFVVVGSLHLITNHCPYLYHILIKKQHTTHFEVDTIPKSASQQGCTFCICFASLIPTTQFSSTY